MTRGTLFLGTLIVLASLATTASAGENTPLTGFTHAKWTQSDGLPGNDVRNIVQAPDGYLWFTTSVSLVRFDGVHFRSFATLPGVPSPTGRGLAVAADGTLWAGLAQGGVVNLRPGSVRYYAPGDGPLPGAVRFILRAHDSAIWVATSEGVSRFENGRWQGFPVPGVSANRWPAMVEDRDGTIGLATINGLFVKRRTDRHFALVPGVSGLVYSVSTDPNGVLWAQADTHRGPMPNGVPAREQSYNLNFARDRRGGVWFSTHFGDGVYFARNPVEFLRMDAAEHFSAADGLSNNYVGALYQDVEGNIWIGSASGLDRLSRTSFQRLPLPRNVGSPLPMTLVTARDGGLLIQPLRVNRSGWVPRTTNTLVSAGNLYLEKSFTAPWPVMVPPGRMTLGLIQRGAQGLVQTLVKGSTLPRDYPDFRYEPNPRVYQPAYEIHFPAPLWDRESFGLNVVARDPSGRIWMTKPSGGLFAVESGSYAPVPEMEDKDVDVVATDQTGQVWAGGTAGLFALTGSHWRHYSETDGLFRGRVSAFYQARDQTFWILGTSLSRWKAGHLSSFQGNVDFSGAASMLEDDEGFTWFAAPSGVFRVAATEWDKADQDPHYRVQYKRFDASNGLPSLPTGRAFQAVRTDDGRLWFILADSVVSIDPRSIVENRLAPPVVIEDARVDGKTVTSDPGVRLPAHARSVDINYTALSFVDPERVRFRVKLEGFDSEWVDAGNRRDAVYTNLAPRRYRFRVIASNNEGVWNETGAAWAFEVLPAFYQTSWFLAVSILLAGFALWVIYRLRLRATTQFLEARYEERLAERARIARELHDTLMQSVAGASLQLNAVAKAIDGTSPELKTTIIGIRAQLDQSFREARHTVWDLRSPTLEDRRLPEALRDTLDAITVPTCRLRLTVNGTPRAYPRKVEEHLLRIVQESVGNALRHAGAATITVELHYDADGVTVSVNDDGMGFDVAAAASGNGHWGLGNMRERAQEIGAELTIASEARLGTKIEATVPWGRSPSAVS